MGFISRLKMALTAFREEFVSGGVISEENFSDPDARKIRYDILWASYENTVYRSIHSWAGTYKTRYALYRYIRNIYNPAYRLGEFWKTHLWGGHLDPLAGEEGCLPIIGKSSLNPAIADIWKWSNWFVNKDVVTLHGSVYGDSILRVIDDVEANKVYIQSVYPGIITDLTKDAFGNIKEYIIEEERPHPVTEAPVTYKETATRDGQNVVFETFLNDAPFAWNGEASSWDEPYGFIPMVHIKHNDVGMEWGWSEFHPARSKMHELDDLTSLLSDQIRKTVNAKWFFTGLDGSDDVSTAMTTTETKARPEPGREEEQALYSSDPNSKVYPMVAPIEFEGVIMHIAEILKDLERDYPELKFDALRVGGEVSGRALRVARQPAEAKVLQRRVNYDDGLKRILQMALSIGGLRNIFEGFSLDSYNSGDLDFEFGEREVFPIDELEKLEEDKAFWEAAKLAKEAGMPLLAYLSFAGWSDEEIEALRNDPEMIAKQEMLENLSEPGMKEGNGDE